MRFYRKRKDLEMNEKRMARELGRYWRALIEEHSLSGTAWEALL
jgi:hypothetical protein